QDCPWPQPPMMFVRESLLKKRLPSCALYEKRQVSMRFHSLPHRTYTKTRCNLLYRKLRLNVAPIVAVLGSQLNWNKTQFYSIAGLRSAHNVDVNDQLR